VLEIHVSNGRPGADDPTPMLLLVELDGHYVCQPGQAVGAEPEPAAAPKASIFDKSNVANDDRLLRKEGINGK